MKFKIFCKKDDSYYTEIHGTEDKLPDCLSGYVSTVENKKSMENGKRWANRRNNDEVVEIDYKEDEEFSARIINCVGRDQSGYTYKVACAIQNKIVLLEFKSHAMMDVLINSGVDKGGFIKEKLILERIGSNAMPIVKGGKYYNQIMSDRAEAEEKSNKKILGIKELIVGNIYKDVNDNKYTYLGQHSIRKVTVSRKYSGNGWNSRYSYEYNKEYGEFKNKHCFVKNNYYKSLTVSKPKLCEDLGVDDEFEIKLEKFKSFSRKERDYYEYEN